MLLLSVPLNATAVDHVAWHPDPTFRGTWGIIATCLSTLLISVWSAIHVDIPTDYRQRSVFSKVRWLVIGLFIPDFLLFVTLNQFCNALELSKHAGTVF